ncbi:tetratricopeptide repeat protein [Reichenbachiella versicolor]|uniref:tetratricopeptide repeat protein n=1 Tax=Reichenbachiella versicolor TaxID=1821036 RepID=UPI0013A57D74|nr:hypothetical protein [Reichenbachiella versicolor]
MNRCYKTIQCVLVLTLFFCGYKAQAKDSVLGDQYLIKGRQLEGKYDSAVYWTGLALAYFETQADTAGILKSLLQVADIEKNDGNYYDSFENLWNAQLLADRFRDDQLSRQVHRELGLLNSYFDRTEDSFTHYFKVLALAKKSKHNVSSAYHAIAARYIDIGDLDMASTYLDSCELLKQKTNYFVKARRGLIAIKRQQYDLAEKLLSQAKRHFEKSRVTYLVVVDTYWGDLKREQGQKQEAIKAYENALEIIRMYKTHTDYEYDLYRKLAALFYELGNGGKAYDYLLKSKEIGDRLFNVKTDHAQSLFDMKNKYQDKVKEQEAELKEREIEIAQNQQEYFNLQLSFALVFLFMVVIVLFVKGRSQIKKHRVEKAHNKQMAEAEREKLEAINEVKNKELTSFALQLIEKETKISELVSYIKDNVPDSKEKQRTIDQSTQKSDFWEEFNARFTQVHTGFYKKLLESYPNLTPTELKHCALVKLKFSSKEMAHLLNISVGSIHIARHRLRKKLDLNREDNLETFIASI